MKTRVNRARIEVGTHLRGVPTLADLQITEEGCHES